jgi:outer membrane protein assembly factor BamE
MKVTIKSQRRPLRRTPSRAVALAAVAGLAVSACVYRMPIQQGNFLQKDQVDQLELGMTRSQVMFLLGTPMVPNGFNNDRWDYYYYAKFNRRTPADTLRLAVYFKDDKVERVDKPLGPGIPPGAEAPIPSESREKIIEESTEKPL